MNTYTPAPLLMRCNDPRIAVHTLVLLACVGPLSACAQESTSQVDGVDFVKRTVSTVEGQKEAAAGDLNGDGHADLVIASRDSVTILRGQGDGTLIVQTRIPAGPNPAGPTVADLDGDGHVDIAVANHDTHLLTLLRGDGSGGFQPFLHSPLTIDVDPHPHAVRAADLDADGHVDLIVDHRAGEGLLILRGTGGGTFESAGTLVDAGGDPYRGMAIGDLNEDGRLDLVTPNPNSVGLVLTSQASTLPNGQHTLETEAGPFAVDVGDFNGDGLLDIVAGLDEGSSLVQVFFGDGGGRFREAEGSPFRPAPGPKMITVGDFNGDGTDDAAIACWNAETVLLLLGGADSIRTTRIPDAEDSWGPTAADLNEDGVDDLVIPDAASDEVLVYVSRNR